MWNQHEKMIRQGNMLRTCERIRWLRVAAATTMSQRVRKGREEALRGALAAGDCGKEFPVAVNSAALINVFQPGPHVGVF